MNSRERYLKSGKAFREGERKMKDVITVISVNPYCMTDENTGKINEGLSVQYCMAADLSKPVYPDDRGFIGYRVLKCSFPKNMLHEFSVVPGVYDCDFEIRPSGAGKAELKPMAVKLVAEAKKS